MLEKPREIALIVLNNILNEKSYSNISIEKHLQDLDDERNKRLVREIVYGVLENNIYLEFIVSKSSKVKIKKIHPSILLILKIGIYQIYFMERIPDSAAVNESVKLAKKYGHKGTISFVNAILRNIIRNKEDLSNLDSLDKLSYISVKYSHPKELVERWVKSFGEEFTEELCKSNNLTPELNIRVNTLKTNKEDLKKLLRDHSPRDGVLSNDILILKNPINIIDSQEYNNGYFTVQDESSSLVGQIMDPKPGSLVIDMCAAPGGKSTHIGQIMGNKGKIYSLDIYKHKIKLINDNAKRLGIGIIESKISDARVYNKDFEGLADYVLVDAPCSGFGLIRRKPDIKLNKNIEDIKTLVSLQGKILENAKRYLKSGGYLIYSTCTIEKDENINQIKDFLDKNHDFKLVSIEDFLPNMKDKSTLKEGYIQLYPHIHGTDGFFIAKMIKE